MMPCLAVLVFLALEFVRPGATSDRPVLLAAGRLNDAPPSRRLREEASAHMSLILVHFKVLVTESERLLLESLGATVDRHVHRRLSDMDRPVYRCRAGIRAHVCTDRCLGMDSAMCLKCVQIVEYVPYDSLLVAAPLSRLADLAV